MSAATKLIGSSGSIWDPKSNQSPFACFTPWDKITESGIPDKVTRVTTVAEPWTLSAVPFVKDKPRDPFNPSDNCNEF